MTSILKLLTNRYIVLIIIILGSFWFWKIIKEDFFISLVLVFQSFLLIKYVTDRKFNLKLMIVLIGLLLFSGFFLIKNNLNKDLWVLNPTEKERFGLRHFYFAQDLDKLYSNRFSLNYYTNWHTFLYKFQRNLFLNIDPNLYFFAGHPRERGDADNFNKYSFLLLPFFILGIIWSFSNKSWRLLIYLTLVSLISALIEPGYFLGPILFSPVVNVITSLGLVSATRYGLKKLS